MNHQGPVLKETEEQGGLQTDGKKMVMDQC